MVTSLWRRWLTRLAGRPRHRPADFRRQPRLLNLEDRCTPTSTLYIDYGDRWPSGVLNTNVGDIDDFSFITFAWNADGVCRAIGASTQSIYIPAK